MLPEATCLAQWGTKQRPPLWGVDEELVSSGRPVSDAVRYKIWDSSPTFRGDKVQADLLSTALGIPQRDSWARAGSRMIDARMEKERSFGLLLGALDLLIESWTPVFSNDELDKHA